MTTPMRHVTGTEIRSSSDTCTRVQLHVLSVLCVDYLIIMYAPIPGHSHPLKTFRVATKDRGSFINRSAKNTLICSWTVSSLEATSAKTGTKPDPTAGFSEKKPQEICVAYAGGFLCFCLGFFGLVFFLQCKVHLVQNKNFSKRHRVKE